MKKALNILVFVSFIIVAWNTNAQINTYGNTNSTIINENPFIDASDFAELPNHLGKGLYFPRTDLTSWTFSTGALDGISFSTAYDGMIVYNTGTGLTLSGQGIQANVIPGFYYFYHPIPVGTEFPGVSAGKWLPIAGVDTTIEKLDDLSDAAYDYTYASLYIGENAGLNQNIADGNSGFNIGIGTDALKLKTDGERNTAIGHQTLTSADYTYASTAVGYQALTNATDSDSNTAIGASSQKSAIDGYENTSLGAYSLQSSVDAYENVALGAYSLQNSVNGSSNTAIGAYSLSNSTGNFNIALGDFAGSSLTTGNYNIIIGNDINFPSNTASSQLNIGNIIYGTNINGDDTTISNGNIGIGAPIPAAKFEIAVNDFNNPTATDGLLIPRFDEFSSTDPGAAQHSMLVYLTQTDGDKTPGFYYWDNTVPDWIALGADSGAKKIDDLLDGKSDSDGTQDGSSVFLGVNAGASDFSTDNRSVGVGFESLKNNLDGFGNVAIGYQTLTSNDEGGNNTTIGYRALALNNVGGGNIAIGYQAGDNATNTDNSIVIGNDIDIVDADQSDQLVIGNLIYGTDVDGHALTVSTGNIGIGAPAPAARLEIAASNATTPTNQDGILIPRIDAFPATNPGVGQHSMLVYLSTTDGLDIPGFYYWDNPTTTWIPFIGSGPAGADGADGAVGAVGPQGIQGVAGNDGADGATGAVGPQGIQGVAGNDGAVGPQGIQGIAGNDGADGAVGPQGIQGVAGNDGADGAVGPQGIQGVAGNDGADGAVGPQGIQGVAGNDGADGAVGPQGIQGVAGNDGADGAVGPQGIQGVTGDDGADGAVGPQGIQGVAGNDGADGAVGAVGPQGIQGVAGNDGADGAVGAVGPQGIQGIAGNDGADGADGAVGPQGIQGVAGNDGADGAVGPQGIQGVAGNDGADGADGQGGVTTAGANVTVTGAGTIGDPYIVSSTDVNTIYTADDSLLGNREVTQGNSNLTFTSNPGSSRTIVNGSFETTGARYASIRTHTLSSNVAWTNTDYAVIITNNSISGNLLLPNPTLNAGRIIAIRNNTGG